MSYEPQKAPKRAKNPANVLTICGDIERRRSPRAILLLFCRYLIDRNRENHYDDWSSPRETNFTGNQKGEEGWLIYKVRKSARTRLRIAPLKTLEEARAIAVFGLLTCKEVTRIRYERLEGKTVRFDEHTPHNIGVPRRDVGSFKLRGVGLEEGGARVCLILLYPH